jgi:Leucine-rich repeat (LRR) protein
MSFNAISGIEENSFDNLPWLVNFNIRDNQLDNLPASVAKLNSLQRLDLVNNNLTGLVLAKPMTLFFFNEN